MDKNRRFAASRAFGQAAGFAPSVTVAGFIAAGFIAAGFIAAFSLLFAACPTDEEGGTSPRVTAPKGTMIVTLSLPKDVGVSANMEEVAIPGKSQTIYPPTTGWQYTLEFEYTADAELFTHDPVSGDFGGSSTKQVAVELEEGDWKITAWVSNGSTKLATGNTTAGISTDPSGIVINLSPYAGTSTDPKGVFSYTLNLPTTASSVTLSLKKGGLDVTGSPNKVCGDETLTYAGTFTNLAAGAYILIVSASDGDQGRDGTADAVHIFNGQTTSFSFTPVFGDYTTVDMDTDLTSLVPFPVIGEEIPVEEIEVPKSLNGQYSGSYTWYADGVRASSGLFTAGVEYSVLMELKPEDGYTFTGTSASLFKHNKAKSIENAGGIVTIVFPVVVEKTIEISLGIDEEIPITGGEDGVYLIAPGTSLTLSVAEGYTNQRWFVNGEVQESNVDEWVIPGDDKIFPNFGTYSVTFIGDKNIGSETMTYAQSIVVRKISANAMSLVLSLKGHVQATGTNRVVLLKSITLEEDITIREGVAFVIPTGTTLTVPSGKKVGIPLPAQNGVVWTPGGTVDMKAGALLGVGDHSFTVPAVGYKFGADVPAPAGSSTDSGYSGYISFYKWAADPVTFLQFAAEEASNSGFVWTLETKTLAPKTNLTTLAEYEAAVSAWYEKAASFGISEDTSKKVPFMHRYVWAIDTTTGGTSEIYGIGICGGPATWDWRYDTGYTVTAVTP